MAEIAVVLVIGTLLLWPARARLRADFATLPGPYALACLVFPGLLLLGQAIDHNEDTYPLVAWDMYTANEPGDPIFVEYIGHLASGGEERLLLAQLFPAGGRHLRARLDSVALKVDRETDTTSRQRAAGQLDSLLTAVAAAWASRHPADSIRAIRVQLGIVPARSYTGPGSISRRVIHEYSVP